EGAAYNSVLWFCGWKGMAEYL
ncbi:MAG: hypothetical protein QG656_1059, partial [Candidatus Hydrogenedentes bacterium]|nr:hypothetical protein [Candidatus Hydrogenedentota bacterium]